MSAGTRAYDLLRGYVNREWERIHHIDQTAAELELQTAMDAPAPLRKPVTKPEPQTIEDASASARRLLGVGLHATFDEIRHAFVRLNKRSDPARFPADSTERVQAAEINRRIQWAYRLLTEDVDAVQKRFRSLEIE